MTTPKTERPKITVSPVTTETAFSTDEILKRRLEGNPFADTRVEIPLREPGRWALKEANDHADPNRHYTIVHLEGWVPVIPSDLADGVTPEALGYRVSEDGFLVKGERNSERLYKMPAEAFKRIQFRKAEANKRGTGSQKAVREDIASATGAALGDEAGTFVQRHLHVSGEDREGPLVD